MCTTKNGNNALSIRSTWENTKLLWLNGVGIRESHWTTSSHSDTDGDVKLGPIVTVIFQNYF
jgi:hypothetical protein